MPSIANQFHGEIILPVPTTGTVSPYTKEQVETLITNAFIAAGITPAEVKMFNGL